MSDEKATSKLTAAIARAESDPGIFNADRFVRDTKAIDARFAGFRMPREAIERLILQAELGKDYCLRCYDATQDPAYLDTIRQLEGHLGELKKHAPWAFPSNTPVDASFPREKQSGYKACNGVLGEAL